MENEMSRRDRKKIHVLNTLVAISLELFMTKGFAETTISDIMKAADLGTGTFYNYFQSKEDILTYLLAQKFAQGKSSLEAVNRSAVSPQEKLAQILTILGDIYEENRQLFSLLKHVGPNQPPHGPDFKDILVSIIAEGQTDGSFSKTIPIEIVIETFMGLVKSAATSRSTISFRKNLAYKLDLFLHGLAPTTNR